MVHTPLSRTFHLAKIGQYLLGVFPSYFSIFAFLLAGFALAGFFRSIIEGSHLGWALVATFCLYVFYFSQQRVMIVRNLLVLFPIVAIWVAEGPLVPLEAEEAQGLAEIIIVCLVAGFGANTYFIAVQVRVIRHRVPVQKRLGKLSTNPELEHRDSSGRLNETKSTIANLFSSKKAKPDKSNRFSSERMA